VLPIADWIFTRLQAALAHDQVLAAVLALHMGIFAAETIMRMIPADYSTYRAQRLLRLLSGGGAVITGFALQTTTQGFIVACVCALAAPTLHDLGFGWVYARWPALKPKALRTDEEMQRCKLP
jgi:hypothetical protein